MDELMSIEETAGYVRLALPLMARLGIPMTPRNYTVWYQYVSGKNKDLHEAIDSMIARKEAFFEEKNQELYQHFCATEDESTLREIRKDLRQIMMVVFKEVADLSGQAERYESLVSKSIDKLSEDAPIHAIRRVVDEIITETKAMATSGKALQQKFKKVTAELTHLRKEVEQAKTEALLDFLTGVANRKAFDETLAEAAGEAVSAGVELSLLMIDIDHFKRFNDQYGHVVGDEVLRFVANKISDMVRGRDLIARYGGEEFAVILPETPLAGARTVAENIRSWFAQEKLKRIATAQRLGTITVSIGAALYRPGEPMESFIGRSDAALYAAKEAGRNRVATESDILSS